MNDKPLVSILSPCYNVEQFLPQCLDSIINQTYENLQIVLIDDGSKDGTWQIMQEYADKDSRIEIYHQENQGVASTRNHLLEKVKGDYVLFVDSDDWCEFGMIEFLVGKALKSEADIVVCGMVKNDEVCSDEYVEEAMDRESTIKKFLFHKELSGSLCNKFVKTSLLQGIRFDNRISYGEDALFCWYVLQRVNTVVQTTKKLYHYRMNDSSICHSSFGPKKLSGHSVWTKICEETADFYPQFLVIAQARFCVETTLLLRDAAHSDYRVMDNVRMLQRTIRKHWHCLNQVNITSIKMKVYAFLVCRSYWFAQIL